MATEDNAIQKLKALPRALSDLPHSPRFLFRRFLTTDANKRVVVLQDRMPVIVRKAIGQNGLGAAGNDRDRLADAQATTNYCQWLVDHPEDGCRGTGSDPKFRRAELARALAAVAYRRRLLVEL